MATRKQDQRRQMQTVPWREDPDILQRLAWVAQLYHQPLSQIMRAVNAYLVNQKPPKPMVGYETIKADRERVREMLQERVVGNAQEHLMSLQVARESVERDILNTESGPMRASLYAILVRITEDMARLDGTWEGGMPAPPGEDEYSKGPALTELLSAGKITREQHRAALLVIAVRSGAKLPKVIEGKVRVIDPPPRQPADLPPPPGKAKVNGSRRFEAEDL